MLVARVRAAAPVRALDDRARERLIPSAYYGAAAAIVGSFLISAAIQFPHVPIRCPFTGSRYEYLRLVMITMATSFRLIDADHLMSASFWVGFGWLDTIQDKCCSPFLSVVLACH